MNKVWWKEAIVYQIYPRSFKDSNGDGIGDLQGIIEKLPYLSDLGITAIWICPFYKSPMVDNGYDIADYYGIDDTFGTMDDFDQLIQMSEKHNIKILIDLVLNHTSSQHEWFKSAISDPNSDYRDYYIFKEGKNGEQPTNWRSVFGGSVWEPTSDEMYYMHTFDKEQPDLNWENPVVRDELYKMINFWLDKGVAGFRIDAITFIKKDQDYPMLPVDSLDGLGHAAPVSQNVEGIGTFLQEMKEKTYGRVDGMTVAEAPGVPYDELDAYIGEDGHFSMIFDFSYNDIDIHESGNWYEEKHWSINELRDAIFNSQLNIQKIGWGALYLENHDQPRSSNKYIPTEQINFYSKSALATMYFCLRGTPFIYQGQEIGMTNVKFECVSQMDDLAAIDQYQRARAAGFSETKALEIANNRSRDNSRTPMHWNDGEYSGFSTVQPWIKVNENYPQINVAAQENNEASLLYFYKQLIQLRKDSKYKDVLTYGEIVPTLLNVDAVIAYERRFMNQNVLVMTNLSDQMLVLPDITFETVVLNNYESIDVLAEGLVLKPYQSLVLAL